MPSSPIRPLQNGVLGDLITVYAQAYHNNTVGSTLIAQSRIHAHNGDSAAAPDSAKKYAPTENGPLSGSFLSAAQKYGPIGRVEFRVFRTEEAHREHTIG